MIRTAARRSKRQARHAGNSRSSASTRDALGHEIGRRFRTQRPVLEQLLVGDAFASPDSAIARAALADRDAKIAAVAALLQHAATTNALARSVAELAASYMHMSCNRLFPSAANAHELVLYDFLERTYLSRIKRRA